MHLSLENNHTRRKTLKRELRAGLRHKMPRMLSGGRWHPNGNRNYLSIAPRRSVRNRARAANAGQYWGNNASRRRSRHSRR